MSITTPTTTYESPGRIAIIGAGMAGLTAAIRLQSAGQDVVLLEKSRGPGGRLASRRVKDQRGSVDIGAQYFTAHNPAFLEFLNQYVGAGSCELWGGVLQHQRDDMAWEPFTAGERYVGVPRMTAISRALSAHVDARFETRIERLTRQADQGLLLTDSHERVHGPFDTLLITAPPAQTQRLLESLDNGALARDTIFTERPLLACWTLALRFDPSLGLDCDGFSSKHPVLQWLANNSSKPGRQGRDEHAGEWWVLHARADWSETHQDADKAWVAEQMLSAFREITGVAPMPAEQFSHRWLYAKPHTTAPGPGYRWYQDQRVGLCGDWLVGGRVEGAFESAQALLGKILP